ncbi:MAG: 50S ribosomal protein L33 [Candidatus Omnitrophota bacterium]|nr:50S ribosomal protein L33 [Candidatus Omnitrophota bacterium]
MAKKKAATETITLRCESCKRQNYTTRKNRVNNPDRMERKKYCRFERKHTLHKEVK